jgi:hypothetical protein
LQVFGAPRFAVSEHGFFRLAHHFLVSSPKVVVAGHGLVFVVFFFVVSFLVVGAACAPITASPWRRRINQSVKQETELRVVLVATSGCALPDVVPSPAAPITASLEGLAAKGQSIGQAGDGTPGCPRGHAGVCKVACTPRRGPGSLNHPAKGVASLQPVPIGWRYVAKPV